MSIESYFFDNKEIVIPESFYRGSIFLPDSRLKHAGMTKMKNSRA